MQGKEFGLKNEVELSGLFIAEVINNADPKAIERVRVRVFGVHDMENKDPENSVWAQHCAPSKGSSGEIPDAGDYIYVMFLQNDFMNPIWIGWLRYIG
jgi:hypothetical protein